jgi:hypothetical protein
MTTLYKCETCAKIVPVSDAWDWMAVNLIGPDFIYDPEKAKGRPTYIGSVPARATGRQFCSKPCLAVYAGSPA